MYNQHGPVLRRYKLKGDTQLCSSLEMFRIKSREEQTCDTFYASVPLEKEPTRIHIQATVLSYFLLDVIIQRKTALKGRKIYFGSI